MYVAWVRRYVAFHGRRHPRELGEAEIAAFLTGLAVERRVTAATQNQALAAVRTTPFLPWVSIPTQVRTRGSKSHN